MIKPKRKFSVGQIVVSTGNPKTAYTVTGYSRGRMVKLIPIIFSRRRTSYAESHYMREEDGLEVTSVKEVMTRYANRPSL